MKGQGRLQTFVIAATIYALTIGAPVKREITPCKASCNKACAAAKDLQQRLAEDLHTYNTTINCSCRINGTLTAPQVYAWGLLNNLNSTVATFPEAVWVSAVKCLNSSDSSNESCQLATEAITLLGAVKHFINHCNITLVNSTLELNHNEANCRSTPEVDSQMKQTLYAASKCTLECLHVSTDAQGTDCCPA